MEKATPKFWMDMEQEEEPYKFSPVFSTNVRISTQNVLNFSFNPFATLL